MKKRIYLVAFALTAVCTPLQSADWPCWRGPQHDGISRDTEATLPWTAAPKVLWERTIGPAFSAVTGIGDRVYTCGTEDDQQEETKDPANNPKDVLYNCM